MEKRLAQAIHAISLLTALLLVALCILAFLAFARGATGFGIFRALPTMSDLSALLDDVLLVFVLIELLKIAAAYLLSQDVILTVFEAALVALVRKLIVAGTDLLVPPKALSLAALFVALALTWWLVRRAERG